MPELDHLDREALERIETDHVALDLHQLEQVLLQKILADRQLTAALLHELRRIAPDRLRPKSELGKQFALFDARRTEHATRV